MWMPHATDLLIGRDARLWFLEELDPRARHDWDPQPGSHLARQIGRYADRLMSLLA